MKPFSDEYLSYINSDEWRRRRALKLFLAGALNGRVECESCHGLYLPSRIDAHHVTYERLGRERLDDIRLLCRSCHECVKEIEAAAQGGDVSELSQELMAVLATIDRRLAPGVPMPPAPLAEKVREYGDMTLDELNARIANKRQSLGIKVAAAKQDD